MKNIFEILSVADKELVHSAMLQFFIESDNWKGDFFKFLDYPLDKEKVVFYPKLEYSNNLQIEDTKKKRIRFDLVLFEDKEQTKPILIIENKFKATPTVEQLELYDKFINPKESNSSKKEPISFNDVKKILFVFSMDSVSGPIIGYCEKHKWEIVPYVKAFDEKSTLLEFLVSKVNEKKYCPTDEKEKLFISDYIELLKGHQCKIIELIKPDKEPWTFPKYDEKNRFYYLQFLLFIQKKIYHQLALNQDFPILESNQDFPILSSNPDFRIKFSLNIDGGRNNTPSVNFWLDSDVGKGCNIHAVYVSIDGDNLRLGFQYERPENANPISKEFIDNFINSLNVLHDKNKIELNPSGYKQVKSNESKDPRYSVYSILTGSLGGLNVMEVLDELPKIISSYFKDSLKFLKNNCK